MLLKQHRCSRIISILLTTLLHSSNKKNNNIIAQRAQQAAAEAQATAGNREPNGGGSGGQNARGPHFAALKCDFSVESGAVAKELCAAGTVMLNDDTIDFRGAPMRHGSPIHPQRMSTQRLM